MAPLTEPKVRVPFTDSTVRSSLAVLLRIYVCRLDLRQTSELRPSARGGFCDCIRDTQKYNGQISLRRRGAPTFGRPRLNYIALPKGISPRTEVQLGRRRGPPGRSPRPCWIHRSIPNLYSCFCCRPSSISPTAKSGNLPK